MKKSKIIAVCLMSALIASLAGCGNEPESGSESKSSNVTTESSGSSGSEAKKTESDTETETSNKEEQAEDTAAEDASTADTENSVSSISFREGVWEAEDCLYYFDADGVSGHIMNYEPKIGIAFMYELNEDGSAVFHMGAADDNTSATVQFAGDSAFILWDNDTETRLNFLLEYTKYNFDNFYSDSELIEIVREFYRNEKGTEPSSVEISGTNGMYAPVDVYVDGEYVTTYSVNRCTLYAEDTVTNEEYRSILAE